MDPDFNKLTHQRVLRAKFSYDHIIRFKNSINSIQFQKKNILGRFYKILKFYESIK